MWRPSLQRRTHHWVDEDSDGPDADRREFIEEIRVAQGRVGFGICRNLLPVLNDRDSAAGRRLELHYERSAPLPKIMEQLWPDDPLQAEVGVAGSTSDERPNQVHRLVGESARRHRRRVGRADQRERLVTVASDAVGDPHRFGYGAIADDEDALPLTIA